MCMNMAFRPAPVNTDFTDEEVRALKDTISLLFAHRDICDENTRKLADNAYHKVKALREQQRKKEEA